MHVDLEDQARFLGSTLLLHRNSCHGTELLDHLDDIRIRRLATSLKLTEEQLSVLRGHLLIIFFLILFNALMHAKKQQQRTTYQMLQCENHRLAFR